MGTSRRGGFGRSPGRPVQRRRLQLRERLGRPGDELAGATPGAVHPRSLHVCTRDDALGALDAAAVTTATSPTTAPGTTFRRVTSTTPEREPVTTTATTTTPSSTTPSTNNGYCYVQPNGTTSCAVPGRPLRRRRRLLLPATGGADRPDDDARAEYASVASFGELALRLLAVGAPPDLVAACHRAALDEIRHASTCERLAGRPPSSFGAISGLLGRRLGGWRRSRRFQLQRLAVEFLVDGWRNEGAAAAQLRDRAETAASPQDRAALISMAEDEQRHADLARAIVTWCFDEEPVAVGRALARVAPIASAA